MKDNLFWAIAMIVIFWLIATACTNKPTVYSEHVPELEYAVMFKHNGGYQVISFPADSIIVLTPKFRFSTTPAGDATYQYKHTRR